MHLARGLPFFFVLSSLFFFLVLWRLRPRLLLLALLLLLLLMPMLMPMPMLMLMLMFVITGQFIFAYCTVDHIVLVRARAHRTNVLQLGHPATQVSHTRHPTRAANKKKTKG